MGRKTLPIEEQFKGLFEGVDSRDGIALLSGKLINILMQKERELHLREKEEERANGYYEREMASALGKLGLSVPRVRSGGFRPSLLPEQWKRGDVSFDDFVQKLVLQSYSPNKIKSLLESMQLPYSAEQVEEMRDDLCEKAQELQTRELPSSACCIYIDAYHADMKDEKTKKVGKMVIYTVIGVSLEGYKEVYGWYVSPGHETKEDWIAVLNNLVSRGLKRIMLIVSDDFSGLDAAVHGIYPSSLHQLCFVHLQRNVRKNLSKADAAEFNRELSLIKKAKNEESGIALFSDLCERFRAKNKSFIAYLLGKKDFYFAFLRFPRPIQKYLYTTNTAENFNSRIEVARVSSGGYFQSQKTADIALFLIARRIAASRWKKPIPAFRESLYEINQMFSLIFHGDK